MDPWLNLKDSNTESNNETLSNFEDNFQPTVGDTLPDSEQYLAILESKLNKLKSDPNVLKQLRERHEACMIQLLQRGATLSSDETVHLDTPIPDSVLLRLLIPQKQAVNFGELVELIHHDHLEIIRQQQSDENEDSTSR